jgi:hypothetical protein
MANRFLSSLFKCGGFDDCYFLAREGFLGALVNSNIKSLISLDSDLGVRIRVQLFMGY